MNLPMRYTARRTAIRRAQAEGRAKIERAIQPLLTRRYNALKRELRRANLRKRLAKSDGFYKDEGETWDDWIDAFEEALAASLAAGILAVFAVEQQFFTSRGKAPMPNFDWREVVDAYEARTGVKIKAIGKDTLTRTQDIITKWYKTAAGLPELIAQLEPIYGAARAELIAFTEMSFVSSEVGLQTMRFYGITLWNWDAGPDACAEICQPIAANNPYKVGDEMPPEKSHPGCVIPGQIVTIQNLSAGFKSFYQGIVIEFTTRSGRKLTVTPNHPILTSGGGWKPAKLFNVGDCFLVSPDTERIVYTVNPYNQAGPAVVEEIFESLKVTSGMSTVSMPAAAEDFHGDALFFDGDVEIVYPDGELRHAMDAALFESVNKSLFGGISGTNLENRTGAKDFGFIGKMGTANGVMGGTSPGAALFRRSVSVLDGLDFAQAALLDAVFPQQTGDDGSINPASLGDFLLRNAALVESDEIVGITESMFDGHVYDLSSDFYGMYTVNGIITHNCLCGYVYLDDNGEEI